MLDPIYRTLAQRLDSLPNGFPPTADGVELRLLAHLFSPDDAALACELSATLETPDANSREAGPTGAAADGAVDRHGQAGADQGGPHPPGLGLRAAAVRCGHLRDARPHD